MAAKNTTTTMAVPVATLRALDRLARIKGVGRAAVVRWALEEYVMRQAAANPTTARALAEATAPEAK